MSFTVETGAGISTANAYDSVANVSTYADDRGLTFSTDTTPNKEGAIVRATAALDAIYRGRFSGYRAQGRNQALEWPRVSSYDREFYTLPSDTIPVEVRKAVAEMAVRELAESGSTMPDLERGGQVRSLQAGSVRIEYGANAGAQTIFQLVEGILASLLGNPQAAFVGNAVRG